MKRENAHFDLQTIERYLRGLGCKLNIVSRGVGTTLWVCTGHVGGLKLDKYNFRSDGSAMPKTFKAFRKVLL